MMDLLRDAPLGQLIRLLTRNSFLKYPEEFEGFRCPNSYKETEVESAISNPELVQETSDTVKPESKASEKPGEKENANDEERDVSPYAIAAEISEDGRPATSRSESTQGTQLTQPPTRRASLARVDTKLALKKSVTRADLEQQFEDAVRAETLPREAIEPEKLDTGTIVVDWYSTDDPSNPQNWSLGKKIFVSGIIYAYTFTFYLGSAIYTPSAPGIMDHFHVTTQIASLGLSMYVLGYGIGPLLFSPLSEIPVVGRNPPYIYTFGLFVILLVPNALAKSVGAFMVLRFLTGFFGSPCLATGGGSLADMFSLLKLPYVLSVWAFSATAGPALGPLLSGFSVVVKGWRWSIWELLWLAGPIWIVMFLFLPETSADNILLRRAQRLRKLTGNVMLRSQGEINQANLTVRDVLTDALWRPIQTVILDPAIAFTCVYTALIYGIYYSFFEAFPIVYLGYFGFNLGEMGLAFLCIIIGAIIGVALYLSYCYWVVEPSIRAHGLGPPERRLVPALFAAFLLPIGLFIFAWTSKPGLPWIGPTIGVLVFTVGIFVVIQCIFLYLPLTYPQYAASLFAGNDFLRSTLAAGTIHFSSPLYINLGVGPGVSLLAGLTCGCILGVYGLWYFGAWLRARSRFAAQ